MVFSQGKDAMGPTRHTTLPRGGERRKCLKLDPLYLVIGPVVFFTFSLYLNVTTFNVTIKNPTPETANFYLKGQERTHPLSFASCPE